MNSRITRIDRYASLWAFTALLAAACGSGPSAPNSGSSSTPITVTGTEKIAWEQAADSASQLAHYRYVGYVDDVRQVLADATCAGTSTSSSFTCSAGLPKMSAGARQLELAVEEIDGLQRQSTRSAPLLLNVVTSRATSLASRPVTTYDGIQLMVDTLATGLPAPSSLAVAPDGRVFIAGRDGNIVVWQNGKVLAAPALQLRDVAQTSDVGLISVSLDAEFPSNGLVFVAYAAGDASGGFAYRVLRLREANGVFGQAAAILEERAPYRSATRGCCRRGPR